MKKVRKLISSTGKDNFQNSGLPSFNRSESFGDYFVCRINTKTKVRVEIFRVNLFYILHM